jgi:CRP-like cAMP-binding protein
MFFIKLGEVEVYRDDRGVTVFINKLREGDFFGEMAAVHGTPRSASVRAMGDVEIFCMRREDLDAILGREPRVKEMFESAISQRASEATERLAESRRVFEGI